VSAAVESDRLLEQAIDYALRSVAEVTPDLMASPTPCSEWDLAMLLQHSCESLAALVEGVRLGCVSPAATTDDTRCTNMVGLFAARAAGLRDGWAQFSRQWVMLGEHRLSLSDFAAAGALEIATHGWDVAWACGQPLPIPSALADQLLAVAPRLVTDRDRAALPGPAGPAAPLFGPPVPAPADASASDRLAAFLGRTCTCGDLE